MSKEYYELSINHPSFKPEKVTLEKETKMCYYLNRIIDKRFYKMDKKSEGGIIGYNKYLWLFESEEEAYKFYENRLIQSKEKVIDKVKLFKKALELSCKNIESIIAKSVDCKGGCPLHNCNKQDLRFCYEKIADYYKDKAKEELIKEKEYG